MLYKSVSVLIKLSLNSPKPTWGLIALTSLDVAGSSHFMEQEQAPPPPPPPEQGHDWGARFSMEIFGYNPYYYGMGNTPIAHPSEITISDSIYLNSPLHWTFDISQIGGSSHPGDESQGQ
jgi:hypothetical protein